jgi:hypothetical protein
MMFLGGCDESSTSPSGGTVTLESADIIFLHHSTGENIWNGGVLQWFDQYATQTGIRYQIVEQEFPKDSPYGWQNYPYDYWNIWVNHAGTSPYMQEPTLEILTAQYQIIVFKHCFPVSYIGPDIGQPNVASEDKRIENYQLQYNALKAKMREFPNTRFLVWTGAALVQNETDAAAATRARTFFDWVKQSWDEAGDNIYIWDFYELETEGSLYMKDAYAEGPYDSHPNSAFSQSVAPLLGQRIVHVIEGRGDTTSLTGR